MIESYHTYFEQYLENYLPLIPRHILRWLARRFSVSQCNQVDALVVPSRPMLEVLRSYGIRTHCHVLPTGIPSSVLMRGQGAAFRLREGITAEQPLLLYVGRLAFEKNIGFLIEMVDKVRRERPDVMLVIAGEGPAREALQRQVAARGLQANVRFVGYLSRVRDLPDCYAAADAFVFASKTETQGLVLLEAMASGVPVITTAVMGTADIMADGMGGLVSDEDTGAFANAVIRLLGDHRLRQRLAREALHKADQWSDSALADRLVTVYEELIDRHRGPATAECIAPSGV